MRMALARSSEQNGWDEPGMEAYDRDESDLQEYGVG